MPQINMAAMGLADDAARGGRIPDEVKRQIALAQLLQKQGSDQSQPIYHPQLGFAKMLASGLGGILQGATESRERAAQAASQGNYSGGLTQGGAPAAAAAAAPPTAPVALPMASADPENIGAGGSPATLASLLMGGGENAPAPQAPQPSQLAMALSGYPASGPAPSRTTLVGDNPMMGGPASPPMTPSIAATPNGDGRGYKDRGDITLRDPDGNVLGVYPYVSGGAGRGSAPPGEYNIDPKMMSGGPLGDRFAISQKGQAPGTAQDPGIPGMTEASTRTLLRIHQSEGAGTLGCIGIIGDSRVYQDFKSNLMHVISASGGQATLKIGSPEAAQVASQMKPVDPTSIPGGIVPDPNNIGAGGGERPVRMASLGGAVPQAAPPQPAMPPAQPPQGGPPMPPPAAPAQAPMQVAQAQAQPPAAGQQPGLGLVPSQSRAAQIQKLMTAAADTRLDPQQRAFASQLMQPDYVFEKDAGGNSLVFDKRDPAAGWRRAGKFEIERWTEEKGPTGQPDLIRSTTTNKPESDPRSTQESKQYDHWVRAERAAGREPPPAPPGVDPKIWREQVSKSGGTNALPAEAKDVAEVRKEVMRLPSYQNYTQALPIYRTMLDTKGRDSKASDLNLVYGLGKIMDPGSVVREGELILAKQTASLPDWLLGAINSLNGGAALTPATRSAILQEAYSRMQSYEGAFHLDAEHYRKLAGRNRMNAEDVIPAFELSPPSTFKKEGVLSDYMRLGKEAERPPPARTLRYNAATGRMEPAQ